MPIDLRLQRSACARALAAALVVLAVAAATPAGAQLPADPDYQFVLGPPRASGKDALDTLDTRVRRALVARACGHELELVRTTDARNDEGLPDGDVYPDLIAKLAFLARPVAPGTTGNCLATVRHRADPAHPMWTPPFTGPDQGLQQVVNDFFVARYGSPCSNVVRTPVSRVTIEGTEWRSLTFTVRPNCLRAQVNTILMTRVRNGNPGSSGLPCWTEGSPPADWDMAVYQLTRIAFLAQRVDPAALLPATQTYLDNELLTISGALQGESYPIFGCGNPDNTTGSAQERADEADFFDNELFADLDDIGKWLLALLAVTLIFLAPFLLPQLGAGAPAPWGALFGAALAAATGSQFIVNWRIAETENHLLMINSSKYLKNQRIIAELVDEDDKQTFRNFNDHLKDWLLERFQQILKEDFVEYHSRPYQAFTVGAILNVHDFAEDPELHRGAAVVLDYVTAKAAVSTSLSRRIVPFRRLAGTNAAFRYGKDPSSPRPQRLLELGAGSDVMLANMLLWSGQTQQLPGWRMAVHAAGSMMNAATSSYVPHELLLDIAIDKSRPYEQRFHHDGWEIYSSGKGWLVTAGGTSTGFAQLAVFTPGFEVTPPFNLFLKNENRGTGAPTTLMPLSGSTRQDRYEDFLRFEGHVYTWSKADDTDDAPMTYDHNLCVRRGFACGIRFELPTGFPSSCFVRPPGTPPQVSFIDSAQCPPYKSAPPFYLVVFRAPCHAEHEACGGSSWGFFEVVDHPGVPIAEFAKLTVERNAARFAEMAGAAESDGIEHCSYRSWRGEVLLFDPDAHDDDSDDYGVLQVDGAAEGDIDDWQRAFGDIVDAGDDGRIRITRPLDPRVIEIDFSDATNPKRVPAVP